MSNCCAVASSKINRCSVSASVLNCSRTRPAHACTKCTTGAGDSTKSVGARCASVTKRATQCSAGYRSKATSCIGTAIPSSCPREQHLASSALCANQAFRLGRQFGLQFHCEVTSDDVEAWLAADDGFAIRANGGDAFAQIRRDTVQYLRAQDELGSRLFGNILDALDG